MPISSRFAVATNILIVLAIKNGDPVRSEDVANFVKTNAVVIRRLCSMLNKAGLTSCQMGKGGGAFLARQPEEITMLDIYLAVEETDLFALPRPSSSRVEMHLYGIFKARTDSAVKAMESELSNTTLADLMVETDQIPALRKALSSTL